MDSALYVPGLWECPKCGFTQQNRVLHAQSGAVSVNTAPELRPCPNDGRDMQPVTWQSLAEFSQKRVGETILQLNAYQQLHPPLPLVQTRLHNEAQDGNCWATCLASLLRIEAIPEIDVRSPDWWQQSESFANQHGFSLLEFPLSTDCVPRIPNHLFCIVSGPSPRPDPTGKEELWHSVLARSDQDAQDLRFWFVHDPHPSAAMLKDIRSVTFAIPQPLHRP